MKNARATLPKRQNRYILDRTYWFNVSGQDFSVWQILKFANYRTVGSGNVDFGACGEDEWLNTPRTTRLRYKNFVERFLKERERTGGHAKLRAALSNSVSGVEEGSDVGSSSYHGDNGLENLAEDEVRRFASGILTHFLLFWAGKT